jgi:hypothetical protein
MIDADTVWTIYNIGLICIGFFIGLGTCALLFTMYEIKKHKEEYTKSLDDKQYRKYMEFRDKQ